MTETEKQERRALEEAIGHFILDLGMIENTMIQALATLTGVAQPQAHFLLNKTAGGAKASLLKSAAEAKGIKLKGTALNKAFGTIHDIMSFRNRLTHDAIAFHSPSQKWMLGQGAATGDLIMGASRLPLDPTYLSMQSKEAWAAIKTIGDAILIPFGGYKYVATPATSTALPPFEYVLTYDLKK